MKVIVIEPTRAAEVRDVPGDTPEQRYESVKSLIGGWLEMVAFSPVADAIVDEEAKIRGDKQPVVNGLATRVVTHFLTKLGRTLMPGDVIVNTLVIVGNRDAKGEVNGEWYDVPQSVIDEVLSVD